MNLIRITAPHFVAGIEIYSNVGHYDYDDKPVPIHRVAPILKYMQGWTTHRILRYCKSKNWKCELLDKEDKK